MDWILYLKAVILGIVEGLTEFLPVSSTGHLIVFGSLLDYTGQEADTFYIAIQAGAIVAVCWYYRERIVRICKGLFTEPAQQKLAWNTIIAFLPAAVIGVMVAKYIKEWLFNPVSVATALVIGGIIILIVERYQDKKSYTPRVATMDDMSWKDALKVGFLQCLAMIPGTSRSGATIIGGLVIGLSRTAATEFSFFLAVPVMFGASGLRGLKYVAKVASGETAMFGTTELLVLLVGTITAFLVSLAVIRFLVSFVRRHSFESFGWYRIALGAAVLLYFLFVH